MSGSSSAGLLDDDGQDQSGWADGTSTFVLGVIDALSHPHQLAQERRRTNHVTEHHIRNMWMQGAEIEEHNRLH